MFGEGQKAPEGEAETEMIVHIKAYCRIPNRQDGQKSNPRGATIG